MCFYDLTETMSYDPLGQVSDAMLDSLSMQLRDAEVRRAEAERAHQVNAYFYNKITNTSFCHH